MLKKLILSGFLFFISTRALGQTITPDSLMEMKAERPASFPGGSAAWRLFLEKNLNPNIPVDRGAPIGKYTVIVQFRVERTGTVSDVEALTNHGYGMENEVVELIKKSGSWIPAIQHQRSVGAYRKQPITFSVTQEGVEITSKIPYVLFTDMDNELKFSIRNVKNENLTFTITQGSIQMADDGKFIARVNEPGKVIIVVYNRKGKRIATVNFEVQSKEMLQFYETSLQGR